MSYTTSSAACIATGCTNTTLDRHGRCAVHLRTSPPECLDAFCTAEPCGWHGYCREHYAEQDSPAPVLRRHRACLLAEQGDGLHHGCECHQTLNAELGTSCTCPTAETLAADALRLADVLAEIDTRTGYAAGQLLRDVAAELAYTCEQCGTVAPRDEHPCAFEHGCPCWRSEPAACLTNR